MKHAQSSFPKLPKPLPTVKRHRSIATSADWSAIAIEYSRETKKIANKANWGIGWDVNDATIKRRIKAITASVDQVRERSCKGPDINPDLEQSIIEKWLRLNSLPMTSYDRIDIKSYTLVAAAIWILDQVTTQQDWEKRLYPLLPTDDRLLDDVEMPDLWHCYYANDLILSVVYVLQNRNRDIIPSGLVKESEPIFTGTLMAEGKQHVDVPSRRAYEGLIDLIPIEAIREAAAHFESQFWAWADRYNDGSTIIERRILDSVHRMNENAKEYNRLRNILEEKIRQFKNSQHQVQQQYKGSKPAINPLLVNPVQSPPKDGLSFRSIDPAPTGMPSFIPTLQQKMDSDPELQEAFGIAHKMEYFEKQYIEGHKEFERSIMDGTSFLTDMLEFGCISGQKAHKDYSIDLSNVLRPLVISNPYEICFALLWLIESGSDLPWIYGVGTGLMLEVVESLPWSVLGYEEEEDPVWLDEDETEKCSMTPDAQEKPPEIPDWYERRYVAEEDKEAFTRSRSLAQILFEETGCIMPSDLHRYDWLHTDLDYYGVNKEDSLLLLHLFTALGHSRRKIRALNLVPDWNEVWQDEQYTVNEQKLTYEELAEKLRQAQADNKRIRDTLHATEKAMRDTRKQLASVQETAQLEHRELADLRELVFRQGNEADEEESPVDESLFPYEVQHDTVVFGGHETWLKAIRPMLTGNIRFISKDLVFDTKIIRNTDVVWIQSNALSHSQFYRIIDSARLYKKPVRFFTWASATKGAWQVMENDRQ